MNINLESSAFLNVSYNNFKIKQAMHFYDYLYNHK